MQLVKMSIPAVAKAVGFVALLLPTGAIKKLLRALSNVIVFLWPVIQGILGMVGCVIGVSVGSFFLYHLLSWGYLVPVSIVESAVTLLDPQAHFNHTFTTIFGWLAMIFDIWFGWILDQEKTGLKYVVTLSVLPLCFDFIKIVLHKQITLFNVADMDQSGMLDFSEFQFASTVYNLNVSSSGPDPLLATANLLPLSEITFDALDVNKDGYISESEFPLVRISSLRLLWSSLNGWKHFISNTWYFLMVWNTVAVGDLCVGGLIYLDTRSNVGLWKNWKLLLSTIMIVSAVYNPLGLVLFMVVKLILNGNLLTLGSIAVLVAAVLLSIPDFFELQPADDLFQQNWTILIGWAGIMLWYWVPSQVEQAKFIVGIGMALPLMNYCNALYQSKLSSTTDALLFRPKMLFEILKQQLPQCDTQSGFQHASCGVTVIYESLTSVLEMEVPSKNSSGTSIFSLSDTQKDMLTGYSTFNLSAHTFLGSLATAYAILDHFYSNYKVPKGVEGINLSILVVTFFAFLLANPAAIGMYLIVVWFALPKYEKDRVPPNPVLDLRPIQWGESLPAVPKFIFFALKAVAGVYCLLICLSSYIFFVVGCYCYSYCPSYRRWTPPEEAANNPLYLQFPAPSALVPTFVRKSSGLFRIYLYSFSESQRKGNLLWWAMFRIQQFASVIEIGPNANDPNPLSAWLAQNFGKVFPFADGIGIGDREMLNLFLLDKKNHKGPNSLAGKVSDTQSKFSHWSTITLGLDPPSQGDKVIEARHILHAWISNFDYATDMTNSGPSLRNLLRKFPVVVDGKLPKDSEIHAVFGDVLYWMATPSSCEGFGNYRLHGQFTRSEKEAYLECVNNLFPFFPNWINFLFLGGFMERKGGRALYKMREAIYRDKGVAYEAAMRASTSLDESQVLRLIASVFAIAGAAVPAKIASAVLKRLASDPQKMGALYRLNPERFIKECARLDPAVFWVNLLLHKVEGLEEVRIGNTVIADGTAVHLYIPFGHLDPKEFPNPLVFDPTRDNLDKSIMTFNGMEFGYYDTGGNPYPRHCPGHDAALKALQIIANHYLPQIEENQDILPSQVAEVSSYLDMNTKLISFATTIKSYMWTRHSYYDYNFEKEDLMTQDYCGFVLPTYDEDFKNKIAPIFDFFAEGATYLPVHDEIWTSSDRAAQAWRRKTLTLFPDLYTKYGENPMDMNTDTVIRRLAFYGLGSHLTERDESEGFTYKNDVMALKKYPVRSGYLTYGACAYFDEHYMPCCIKLGYNGETINRPQSQDPASERKWEFAKWVWKVSVFTYVTLRDHLLSTHLIKSNALVECSRNKLPIDHVLRTILKPFTFQTIYINSLAGRTLFCKNGLAARVWAFEDITVVLNDLHEQYSYDDKFVKLEGENEAHFPIGKDYAKLRKIVQSYVEDTLSLIDFDDTVKSFYKDLVKKLKVTRESGLLACNIQNLQRVLTHLIINGTGIHEYVGHISDYQDFPSLTGAKIVQDLLREPTQSYAINTALTTSTGIIQPKLLDDWISLLDRLPAGQVRSAKRHYADFKNKLVQMSIDIKNRERAIEDGRNTAQAFPFPYFSPERLEAAVSK